MDNHLILKTPILIFIFLMNSVLPSQSQNVLLELKTEVMASEMKFRWQDYNFKNQAKSDNKLLAGFSLGASIELKNMLFIKAAIGSLNFEESVDFEWTTPSYERRLIGDFTIKQTFIEVLPELRFFDKKWFYVNAGMGVCRTGKREIFDGERSVNRLDQFGFTKEGDYPIYQKGNIFYAANVGVNLVLNRVRLIAELGIRNSEITQEGSEIPGIGFNQAGAKIGVGYMFN